MFLHIGNEIMVRHKEIIAILDYNKLKRSINSDGLIKNIFSKENEDQNDLKNKHIKTIVITKNKTFFSSISSGTIEKRMENINY